MAREVTDPVRAACLQPLRIAWDGVQLHATPTIAAKEIDGVIERLQRLRTLVDRPTLILPGSLK